MNRRSFLSRIVGASAVSVVPVTASTDRIVPQEWPWSPGTALRYRGYRIFWTGWKGSQANTRLFGQWIGYPERGFGRHDVPDREPYLYVSVPGFIGGPYRPGAQFDLSSRGRLHTIHTSPEEAEQWVAEGLDYIKELAYAYQGTHAEIIRYSSYQFPRDPDTTKFIIGVD